MEDTFDKLLDIQAELQKKYYPELNGKSQEELMLINTRAMIHETIEVENELNWKHWKKSIAVDDDKVINEIADQFIFMMNEIIICGIDTEEFYEIVVDKMLVNIDRKTSGY